MMNNALCFGVALIAFARFQGFKDSQTQVEYFLKPFGGKKSRKKAVVNIFCDCKTTAKNN